MGCPARADFEPLAQLDDVVHDRLARVAGVPDRAPSPDEANPNPDLVNTLLENGRNDGQALVDAIGANYATVNSALTTAQSAVGGE